MRPCGARKTPVAARCGPAYPGTLRAARPVPEVESAGSRAPAVLEREPPVSSTCASPRPEGYQAPSASRECSLLCSALLSLPVEYSREAASCSPAVDLLDEQQSQRNDRALRTTYEAGVSRRPPLSGSNLAVSTVGTPVPGNLERRGRNC